MILVNDYRFAENEFYDYANDYENCRHHESRS